MIRKFLLFLSVLGMVACTNDAFETGDSDFSYLRSDFVEAKTDASAKFVSAVTDDDEIVNLSVPLSASWATTPDSVYRAQLYYNKKGEVNEPVAISWVPVLKPSTPSDDDSAGDDPVIFKSAWLSKNGKYLNLGLMLKTGPTSDETQRHSVGVVCDSIVTDGDATKTYYLRFRHQQNQVPEYYSTHFYASIPTSAFHKGTRLQLLLHTYEGVEVKSFELY